MAAVQHVGVRRLVTVLMFVALLFTVAPAEPAEAATNKQIRSALTKKVNAARTKRGLRALKVSIYVCPAALTDTRCMLRFSQGHAKQMGGAGKLFHDGRKRLWKEVPVGAWWRAENVGYVSPGPKAAGRVHRAFMRSPAHRDNILARRATHLAIGVFQNNKGVWFVQRFTDLKPLR